ncbi:hypothetical protein GCM10007332_24060 [Epilithonimonas arachidiradicis]|nr:hypothetical protein GCM10007332_24060 [Epilithonimonas arachidiradicis]
MIYSQSDKEILLLYKNVIEKSDSLLAIGKIAQIDSKKVLSDARLADKEYPEKYFEKSMEYFKNHQYNESGFLYYLGKMRAEDLNNLGQEHYTTGSDYDTILEEGLFIYLSADADNYAKILQMAMDFYNENPYSYISKTKGYKKLKDPKKYSELIKMLQGDKTKIQTELNMQRDDMKNRITPYFQLLKEN